MPFSRSLGDGLFELRFALGAHRQRVTYRFGTERTIVLLTTFRKQRQNERIEVARARRQGDLCRRIHDNEGKA